MGYGEETEEDFPVSCLNLLEAGHCLHWCHIQKEARGLGYSVEQCPVFEYQWVAHPDSQNPSYTDSKQHDLLLEPTT